MRNKSIVHAIAFLAVLFMVGCTTNIEPPTGPVGTVVTFDPPPSTYFCGPDPLNQYWVEMSVGGELRATACITEMSFEIPDTFVPGEEISIKIWSTQTFYGCGLTCGDFVNGSFLVTEGTGNFQF